MFLRVTQIFTVHDFSNIGKEDSNLSVSDILEAKERWESSKNKVAKKSIKPLKSRRRKSRSGSYTVQAVGPGQWSGWGK